jgi:hypothetical protein
MPRYFVRWSIDIFDADNPVDAALAALKIQRDPESVATYFEVAEVVEEDGEAKAPYPPTVFTGINLDF